MTNEEESQAPRRGSWVKYQPSAEEVVQLLSVGASESYEVWQGLPSHLKFEPAKSRGNFDSLVCRAGKNYVWVDHKSLEAYKQDSQTFFLAFGRHGRIESVKAMTPVKSLDEGIERAKILTEIDILEHKKDKLEKARNQRKGDGMQRKQYDSMINKIISSINENMEKYRAVLHKYKRG